jgi:tetratricopeptide (TPR) repeat protein
MELGLPAAPFACIPLLCVHLIAALPLAVLVTRPPALRLRVAGGVPLVLLGLACSAALTAGWLALGPLMQPRIQAHAGNVSTNALVRSGISLVLLLPAILPIATRLPLGRPAAGTAGFLATMLLATLPPLMFAHQVNRAESQRLASLLETGRLKRALGSAATLVDLGSRQTIARSSPGRLQRDLETRLEILQRRLALATPLSSMTPEMRREHAFRLVQIDRPEDAAAVLEPIAYHDPTAALLLASIARDRQQPERAAGLYRRVLEILNSPGSLEAKPARSALLRTAWDGLIDALRAEHRPDLAWNAVQSASQALPKDETHFLVLRGQIALDQGRADLALACFEQAIRLDPALAQGLKADLKRIRTQTPACLPRWRGQLEHSPSRHDESLHQPAALLEERTRPLAGRTLRVRHPA